MKSKAVTPEQSSWHGEEAQADELSADPAGAEANFGADAANASVHSASLTRVDTL